MGHLAGELDITSLEVCGFAWLLAIHGTDLPCLWGPPASQPRLLTRCRPLQHPRAPRPPVFGCLRSTSHDAQRQAQRQRPAECPAQGHPLGPPQTGGQQALCRLRVAGSHLGQRELGRLCLPQLLRCAGRRRRAGGAVAATAGPWCWVLPSCAADNSPTFVRRCPLSCVPPAH